MEKYSGENIDYTSRRMVNELEGEGDQDSRSVESPK